MMVFKGSSLTFGASNYMDATMLDDDAIVSTGGVDGEQEDEDEDDGNNDSMEMNTATSISAIRIMAITLAILVLWHRNLES